MAFILPWTLIAYRAMLLHTKQCVVVAVLTIVAAVWTATVTPGPLAGIAFFYDIFVEVAVLAAVEAIVRLWASVVNVRTTGRH